MTAPPSRQSGFSFSFLYRRQVGFSEGDVRSICDVCNSRKGGAGKIGNKGVGFKSVFMVRCEIRLD